MLKGLARLVLTAGLVVGTVCACDAASGIVGRFNGRDIGVFIKEVKNESGNDNVSADLFKKELEKAFANRKSVSFRMVDNQAASDVTISAAITKFQYLKTGPIKPSVSIVTTAVDAVATALENYVDMNVNMTVTDSRSGEVLWRDDVYDFDKRIMTEREGIPVIFDKVARKCVAKAFGKRK